MYYLYLKLHDVFTGIQFQRMSGLRDRGREGLTVLWGQRGLQPVPTQPTQVSHLLKPHHCADAVGRGWGGGHSAGCKELRKPGKTGRFTGSLEESEIRGAERVLSG